MTFVIAELTRTVNSIGTIRALKNILIGTNPDTRIAW